MAASPIRVIATVCIQHCFRRLIERTMHRYIYDIHSRKVDCYEVTAIEFNCYAGHGCFHFRINRIGGGRSDQKSNRYC